ncbi:hypothetical protein P3T36_006197 [Kitasatospora sp. MAP12-15]|uniref:DUF5134 domain-containing protein n=1 Tax=unclassified Kitasatospora TaxID=2633591 RepID=UPI0024770941|nr:DUF5134 domain-containing protein [Kitasatospora sp. MAP12-44]MDH6109114.1 hypothetical protein [Kitasatospora sp. MAP12-44]
MHGAAVLSWLLVMVTAATGVLCLVRMRGAEPGRRSLHESDYESAAAEAAMGLGMAVMIAAGDRLPPPLWAGLFGLLAAVSLLAAAGGGTAALRAHRLHHAVGALAMVYMVLAMGGGRQQPGMAMDPASPGVPLVTGLLLLYFGCYALWTGSRLFTVNGPGGPSGRSTHGVLQGGDLPQACRLAMGVGMFAMLLSM